MPYFSRYRANTARTRVAVQSTSLDSYNRAYQHYIKIANDFAKNKGKHDFNIGVNGGMMDRFFGQNISATEKTCNQVIEYIDKNLGDAGAEFNKFVNYKKLINPNKPMSLHRRTIYYFYCQKVYNDG